jgi:hypothetical protein
MRVALLSATLLVLTAHTASARDASDDPVPVAEATDDTQDQAQAVEAVVEPVLNPRVECIIGKESGWRDVPNRQGSGATGPGQYMPSTWRAHTLEMGEPWLNIHSLADVRRVAAYDLSMGRRRQWVVTGCP